MKQRGMTLLEVMVALFIFAITGTAMIKAASDHLYSLGQVEEITFATWVANNRLTQLQLESSWPPKNNQQGEEEMAGRIWQWQQKVSATADEDMRQVEVQVSLEGAAITSVVTFVTPPGNKS